MAPLDSHSATRSAPDLPQRPTPSEVVVESIEWMFEPSWKGVRLMARLHGGRISITDEHGEPAAPELAEAAQLLEPVIDADQALIDGVWTSMRLADEGVIGEARDRIGEERRPAFVAVDLVELDGQRLHDVPYLERRRLLESVLAEQARVRISQAVRQPIQSCLPAWRALGFEHYLAKHINSRYHPGEASEQWLRISTAGQPQRSLVDILLGARQRKLPRIADDGTPSTGRTPRR
jgi:bifunctional non-homologous end joining protein LigD